MCDIQPKQQAFTRNRYDDFHHIDESVKKSEVSKLASTGHKWDTIYSEVQKCIMLCAPCHRKIHAGLLTLLKTDKTAV